MVCVHDWFQERIELQAIADDVKPKDQRVLRSDGVFRASPRTWLVFADLAFAFLGYLRAALIGLAGSELHDPVRGVPTTVALFTTRNKKKK